MKHAILINNKKGITFDCQIFNSEEEFNSCKELHRRNNKIEFFGYSLQNGVNGEHVKLYTLDTNSGKGKIKFNDFIRGSHVLDIIASNKNISIINLLDNNTGEITPLRDINTECIYHFICEYDER